MLRILSGLLAGSMLPFESGGGSVGKAPGISSIRLAEGSRYSQAKPPSGVTLGAESATGSSRRFNWRRPVCLTAWKAGGNNGDIDPVAEMASRVSYRLMLPHAQEDPLPGAPPPTLSESYRHVINIKQAAVSCRGSSAWLWDYFWFMIAPVCAKDHGLTPDRLGVIAWLTKRCRWRRLNGSSGTTLVVVRA